MRLTKGKTYKVKWHDAQSFSDWKTAEQLLNTPPAIVQATYIYVGRGKGGLCFAGEHGDGDFGNATIIPAGMIKAVKEVR